MPSVPLQPGTPRVKSASARGPLYLDMSDTMNRDVQLAAERVVWRAVTVAFDTLKAATRLQEEAGFDPTKARVLVSTFAEGMVENLATKDDIAGLRRDFKTLATKEELADLRREVAGLHREFKTLATKEELATLRGELKQTDARLSGQISKVQERLTVRLGGAVAAAVAILVAVDKLL